MKRRTLIAGVVSVAGVVAASKAWAQPTGLLPAEQEPLPEYVSTTVEAVYQVPGKTKEEGTYPVVVLKALDPEQYLPIWVGMTEGQSILSALQNVTPLRPMSHDLMVELVKALKGRVEAVYIHRGAEHSTYYGNVKVIGNGLETLVDSRPSDALALAVRVQAPVLVAKELLRPMKLDELKVELGQN